MVIGAVGIWIALFEAYIAIQSGTGTAAVNPEVYQSILTFFAAVGSISCVQILIMEDEDKHLRSLFVLVLIVFLILAVTVPYLIRFSGFSSFWGVFVPLITIFPQASRLRI